MLIGVGPRARRWSSGWWSRRRRSARSCGPASPTARWSRRWASTTGRSRSPSWASGSMLATVAGVLAAPVYGARPGLDKTILLLALVVIVIGGLGSIRGALVGRAGDRPGGVAGPGPGARVRVVHPLRHAGPGADRAAARAVRREGGRTDERHPRQLGRTGRAGHRSRGRRHRTAARGSMLRRRGLPGSCVRRSWCWPRCRCSSPRSPRTPSSRILIFALFAVSLDLLVGITGLPSLGHAAYFGDRRLHGRAGVDPLDQRGADAGPARRRGRGRRRCRHRLAVPSAAAVSTS